MTLSWLSAELAALDEGGLLRRLSARESPQAAEIVVDGQPLVNFGSNDYLALAADSRLAAAATAAIQAEGFGSGASPLITGHSAVHQRLQERLAEFEGTEAALLFPSGFAANLAAVTALAGPGDVVFGDAKNHASLWDGCRLSRADVRVYRHADWRQLDAHLRRASGYRRRLIVTDGLFSMDGDLAPLVELAEVARRHEAMLVVDEAHATGVFGDRGRGTAEYLGVEDAVTARVGTLSKALGCAGGFICGSRPLIDWLINRARSYIYSTAAPAVISAAAMAALDIVIAQPQRRRELLQRAAALRRRLAELGWSVGQSASHIIPIVVGQPQRAVELSRQLRWQGLLAPAIRPPTVPEGEACLRVSLTYGHSEEQIAAPVAALGMESPPPAADSQSLPLSLEVVDEDRLAPELDAAIRRLLCECFPLDAETFSARRAWNGVQPLFSVLGRHGDKLVGHVGIVDRRVACAGTPLRVAGIQSLAVAPDWRRSGLAQRLMTTAMDEARSRGVCFGLLFCVPELERFYAGLGWRRIDRAVTIRDVSGQTVPLTAKNISMELALAGNPLPPGPIDLEGRDW